MAMAKTPRLGIAMMQPASTAMCKSHDKNTHTHTPTIWRKTARQVNEMKTKHIHKHAIALTSELVKRKIE